MDSFKNNDPFKKFVKSRLADYEKEVPSSGWEELESSLFAMQKTKEVRTKWLLSSVVAVAAALIGVIFVFQNIDKELPTQTAEYQLAPRPTPINKDIKPFITKQHTTEIEKSAPALFTDNRASSQSNTSVSVATSKNEKVTLSTPLEITHQKEDLAPTTSNDEKSKSKDKSADMDEETNQKMLQDFINDGKRSFDDIDNIKSTKSRSKHSISLAGRSGLSSSQHTNTLPTTLRSSVSESYDTYTISKMQTSNKEKEVSSESETKHMQPVALGVLTSFHLTRRLQIETGLMYTYLSSETKNKSTDFRNSEKVQFHYVGIPVNLNYTLLSVNKLDLFVTAGAMIEKDISGKINHSDEKTTPSLINSEYTNTSSSKINQKNPQFSVAGGVGITYPIYDKARLFGKVGGRYYIKANNEYKTYYSDEKFGLDIQLGIKFNF